MQCPIGHTGAANACTMTTDLVVDLRFTEVHIALKSHTLPALIAFE